MGMGGYQLQHELWLPRWRDWHIYISFRDKAAILRKPTAYSSVSLESTEDTNSLLIKRPVGTEISLCRAGILTVMDWAMAVAVVLRYGCEQGWFGHNGYEARRYPSVSFDCCHSCWWPPQIGWGWLIAGVIEDSFLHEVLFILCMTTFSTILCQNVPWIAWQALISVGQDKGIHGQFICHRSVDSA